MTVRSLHCNSRTVFFSVEHDFDLIAPDASDRNGKKSCKQMVAPVRTNAKQSGWATLPLYVYLHNYNFLRVTLHFVPRSGFVLSLRSTNNFRFTRQIISKRQEEGLRFRKRIRNSNMRQRVRKTPAALPQCVLIGQQFYYFLLSCRLRTFDEISFG